MDSNDFNLEKVLGDENTLHAEILGMGNVQCKDPEQVRLRVIDLEEKCRRYTEYGGKEVDQASLKSCLTNMLDDDTTKMTAGIPRKVSNIPRLPPGAAQLHH